MSRVYGFHGGGFAVCWIVDNRGFGDLVHDGDFMSCCLSKQ